MHVRPAQMALAFAEKKESLQGVFHPTRPLMHHRLCNTVLKKLYYVRRFFPELGDRAIRVGVTRAAGGMAVPGGNELWFNPHGLSHHVIAHEFVHLLQGSNGIPTGERSCDVYALARHWTLNDTAPCYVRIPRLLLDANGRIAPSGALMIHASAAQAIEMRNGGTRNYIAFFERSLENAVQRAATGDALANAAF